jgi:hypothetical protein
MPIIIEIRTCHPVIPKNSLETAALLLISRSVGDEWIEPSTKPFL